MPGRVVIMAACVAALAVPTLAVSAHAEDASTPRATDAPDEAPADPQLVLAIAMLRALSEQQDYDRILSLTEQFPAAVRDAPAVQRYAASALLAVGRTDEAGRRLLAAAAQDEARAPDAAALQRGDAHAILGEVDEARRTYRALALRSESAPVREAARGRLESLDARRTWRVDASLALAPDSNVNAATDNDSLDLFGLQFRLADDARRTSGVGVTGSLDVARRHRSGRDVDLVGRLRLSGSKYDDSAFDLLGGTISAGPSFRLGARWAVAPEVEVQRVWFGGDVHSDGAGGGVTLQGQAGERYAFAVHASLLEVDYALSDARDGALASLGAGGSRRSADDVSSSSARITLDRYDAEAETETFWSTNLVVGRRQALPLDMVALVEPSLTWRRHDEAALAFGDVREDTTGSVFARLEHRTWTWRGLTPYASYRYTRNWSSLDLYDYSRSRFEFGIVKAF